MNSSEELLMDYSYTSLRISTYPSLSEITQPSVHDIYNMKINESRREDLSFSIENIRAQRAMGVWGLAPMKRR